MKYFLGGLGLWQESHIPPWECYDSQAFFRRMKTIDQYVAKNLNDKHEKSIQRYNQKWSDQTIFEQEEKVWYRRPENSGHKLDSRWLGPALIIGREGEHSYIIQVKPEVQMKAHQNLLKKYVNEKVFGQALPLFYPKRTVIDPEAQSNGWAV